MEAHIIHPQKHHQASIIWLHGLGADGFDFAPLAKQLGLIEETVKFIFPHAPIRAITANGGYKMRAWYDIVTFDRERFIHDVEGIEASSQAVHKLVQAEIEQGIPPAHIILAGFSQGGAIALFAGLTSPYPLGGILALSTYLPAPDILKARSDLKKPPILIQHGSLDTIVLPEAAELSCRYLQEMGCEVALDIYPMAHSVCEAELVRIKAWLNGLISN